MGTLRLRVSLKVPGKILSDWPSVEWDRPSMPKNVGTGIVGLNPLPLALWGPSLHHKGLCEITFAGEIFAVR